MTSRSELEPVLFKSGDYLVTTRVVTLAINDVVTEPHKVFVVVHRPTGVVAGKSLQLPDAIRGCVNLDREQRVVDADPYDLSPQDGTGRPS